MARRMSSVVPKKSLACSGRRETSFRMYISWPRLMATKNVAEKPSAQLKWPYASGPR